MEMKIDSQKIRQLREARGWSQEHLAEVAGLSARTVQRIEAEGKASPESRMALAAALGVDAASFGLPAAEAAVDAPAEQVPAAGRPHRRDPSRGLQHQFLVYLLVCGGLVLLDLARHGGITWSKWPLLGWGFALLLQLLLRRRDEPPVSTAQ